MGTPRRPGYDPPVTLQPSDTQLDEHPEVAALCAELKELATSAKDAVAALRPLLKPAAHDDLQKLGDQLGSIRARLEPLPEAAPRARALDLVDALETRRKADLEALRERLGPDLKAAAEAAGLTMKVLSREEPIRVRIPPFGVTIDRERGRATLEFAREAVGECAADAEAIVAAHGEARAALEAGFEPEAFFAACLDAWKAARATGAASETTGRVEITAFMPFLALFLQPTAFRTSPSARNFREVTRAAFAYGVMRLRQERRLISGGWRFNLGVATGTSASSKKNVIWFEDEHGDGEFKLTVFFTRMDGGPAGDSVDSAHA